MLLHSSIFSDVGASTKPGALQYFASRGYKVLVPDWPGTGRSGYIPADQLDGATVSAGLSQLFSKLDAPAVLLVHSISGAFGWKVLEEHGDKVSHVVAVSPASPGNILPEGKIVGEENGVLEVSMQQFKLKLSTKDPFFPDDAWSKKKLIGQGSRFPKIQ